MQRSVRERATALSTRRPATAFRGRAARVRMLCAGLIAALTGCSDVSETLWPSMNAPEPATGQVAAAPAPVAAVPAAPRTPVTSSSTAVPVPGGPIQTDVGQRARQLREEAQRLLNSVTARSNTVQQIRGQAVQHVQGYQNNVGAVSARLAVGTTVGNPVLQQQWVQASQQLDLISGDSSRLSALMGEVGNDSSAAQGLLQQIARTFSLPGAVEDDHRFLVNAEDDVNRAIVLNNRQIGEINGDINRLNTYVSRERPNLAQLSNAIATGQLSGGPIAAGSFSPSRREVIEESSPRSRSLSSNTAPTRSIGRAPAPSRAAPARAPAPQRAAAEPAGRRPLVVIRFDRPNPAYEQPLYTAVSRALERRPNVTFDLVAMTPTRGGNASRARSEGQRVLKTLTDMGLPANRVRVSQSSSGSISANEVHLFVR